MGKNRIIKILGGIIGGLVAHKILLKYTNRPESLNHLQSEVDNYMENALDLVTEFNWNEKDRKRIIDVALKDLNSELNEPHFSDVKFPARDAKKLIDETLIEVRG